MFKYIVCTVSSYFDTELDQSMYKVDLPLQGFKTEHEADTWCDLIYPFYECVQVVRLENFHQSFRNGKDL